VRIGAILTLVNTLARTKESLKVGSAEVARAVGATAFAALLFAPHAATHTLETTKVETTVVGLPVELGFYPGASRLDVLNQARVYSDSEVEGVGLDATITGLPRIESAAQASDLIAPQRLDVYASLADSPREALEGYAPQLRDEATRNGLEYVTGHAVPYGLALYGALGMLRLRRKLAESRDESARFDLTPLYVTGLATMALASSLTMADQNHQQWRASGGVPKGLSTIEALDGTSLEGAKIDNAGLEPTLNTAIRYGLRLKDRRQAYRQRYLDEAAPNLVTALNTLGAPRDDEQLLVFISDLHAGKAGISLATLMVETLQGRFGTEVVAHTMNLGDTLYDPGLQGATLKDQAAIMKEGVQVLTPGNHDVDDTPQLAQNAGMVVPEGRETVEGIDIYSVADPEQTPFLQDSYYPDPSINQQTIAQEAYDSTTDERVDLINFHDPEAIESLVGAENRIDLTAEGSLTTCEDNDDFRDINAGMVSAGHSHDQYPINMECNSDGTWFVVNLQGTGGGAEESPTFNRWSDPDGAPIKTISYRLFYRNTVHGSITGFADVEIARDGSVGPIFRTSIGTPDGAPFDMSEGDASEIRKRAPRQS
jgi:hypothetical protein